MKTAGQPQRTRFSLLKLSMVSSSATLDSCNFADMSEANGRSICWRSVAATLPGRNNKSCRKRYFHLPPSVSLVGKTRPFLQVDPFLEPRSAKRYASVGVAYLVV